MKDGGHYCSRPLVYHIVPMLWVTKVRHTSTRRNSKREMTGDYTHFSHSIDLMIVEAGTALERREPGIDTGYKHFCYPVERMTGQVLAVNKRHPLVSDHLESRECVHHWDVGQQQNFHQRHRHIHETVPNGLDILLGLVLIVHMVLSAAARNSAAAAAVGTGVQHHIYPVGHWVHCWKKMAQAAAARPLNVQNTVETRESSK